VAVHIEREKTGEGVNSKEEENDPAHGPVRKQKRSCTLNPKKKRERENQNSLAQKERKNRRKFAITNNGHSPSDNMHDG